MRILVVIVVAGLMAPSPAQAESRWLEFGDVGDDRYSIDVNSVILNYSGISKAWIKIVHAKEKKNGEKWAVSRWEIVCQQHSMRVTSRTGYNAAGESISSNNSSNSLYNDIIPDTAGQQVEDFICIEPK